MRKLARTGSSALVLLTMMFVGSLVLWVGVPLLWLWVGSLVQGETGSLGAALGVMALGVVLSLFAIVPMLGWLNHKYSHLREARGLEPYGQVALEGVLVVSAGVALVGFAVWFFLFSGSEPIPFELSY